MALRKQVEREMRAECAANGLTKEEKKQLKRIQISERKQKAEKLKKQLASEQLKKEKLERQQTKQKKTQRKQTQKYKKQKIQEHTETLAEISKQKEKISTVAPLPADDVIKNESRAQRLKRWQREDTTLNLNDNQCAMRRQLERKIRSL